MLIAFEGLDQSGKETQAQRLGERLTAEGHRVRLVSFPDYGTSIGEELARVVDTPVHQVAPEPVRCLRGQGAPTLQLKVGLIVFSGEAQVAVVAIVLGQAALFGDAKRSLRP